jgi:hypothetical protein
MSSREGLEHPGGRKCEGFRRADKSVDEVVPAGRLGVGLVKPARQLLASGIRRLVPQPVIQTIEDLHLGPSHGSVGLGLGKTDALVMIPNRPSQALPEISVFG